MLTDTYNQPVSLKNVFAECVHVVRRVSEMDVATKRWYYAMHGLSEAQRAWAVKNSRRSIAVSQAAADEILADNGVIKLPLRKAARVAQFIARQVAISSMETIGRAGDWFSGRGRPRFSLRVPSRIRLMRLAASRQAASYSRSPSW